MSLPGWLMVLGNAAYALGLLAIAVAVLSVVGAQGGGLLFSVFGVGLVMVFLRIGRSRRMAAAAGRTSARVRQT